MTDLQAINEDYKEKYGFHVEETAVYRTDKGLTEDVVRSLSARKGEPAWMLDFRLKALATFRAKTMPTWGADLSHIDFDNITYYLKPSDNNARTWDDVPDHIKKTFDRLGIPEAERKFLGGVGAQFECLSGDSVIFTNPKGPVRIKDIEPDTVVFSLDEVSNRFVRTKVKRVAYKGKRQVYELKVGTKTIKATHNHPFLALVHRKKEGGRRGRYSREWKYLSELSKGDLIAVMKKVPSDGSSQHLPSIETSSRDRTYSLPRTTSEDLLWFLGLYLGDGFIHNEKGKRKCRIEIAIPEKDTALRSELCAVIKRVFNYSAKTGDAWRVTIGSTAIARWIQKIGFYGRARTKHVPTWVFNLPANEVLAFLGGYIDADGHVRDAKKNHDISMTSVNKKLLQSVRYLCACQGIGTSNINEFKQPYTYKGHTREVIAYRMQLSGNFDQVKCRSPARVDRMNKRKWHHNLTHVGNSTFKKHTSEEFGFARIKSIQRAGIEPVYDIEIDGPHNFISEGILVHNSESVYHSLREDLSKLGVIFTDMDTALKEHPEIVKKYLGTIIPTGDNKFAALNSAVWSGGSFVYVPPGVKVGVPLQAYFRINAKNMGQFERTLIIVDEGADVHYIEGCTAPVYSTDSLHAAVVEVIALKDAKVRYTTIQNWSGDVYNLVTKRAIAHENATVEWIDGNLGSKITMKYPSVILKGRNSKADILSIAFAGKNQHQDAGAKVIHLAPDTTSRIVSKSVSKDGGRTSYRGLLRIGKGARNVKSTVQCDALLLDDTSRSDTYPTMRIEEDDATIAHEATVGKVGQEQLFYLMQRGLSEEQAMALIVLGFIAEFTKALPLEYSIELNKLIELEMEGSIG